MSVCAVTAISDRVVAVQEGCRCRDLNREINGSDATHAAVLQGRAFVGLVAISELSSATEETTVGELTSNDFPIAVHEEASLAEVGRRMIESGSHALPVVGADGIYRGTVTPHSLLSALLTEGASPPSVVKSTPLDGAVEPRPFELTRDLRQANRILQAEVWERIKAEAALWRSETLLRSVFDNVPATITRLSLDGTITFINRTVPGFTRDGVVGRHVTELVGPERRSDVSRLLTAAIETGQSQSGEFPGVGFDGSEKIFSCCVAPVREGRKVVGLISVATDITETKRAEEQARELQTELAHVSRLSTMGEMASGLAHELNQPLAAIIAYADACQELVESGRIDEAQLLEVLRAIASQADRSGKIIQRLRNLVRRGRPQRVPIRINEAVREVASLLEAEIRHIGASLRLDLDVRVPAAAADFVQLQQVLLNLMRNGLDAMVDGEPGRRELAVSTRCLPGDQVEVAIRDSGRGVAQEYVSRLFEPFFTTKSEGLGMGLPISRTIIEAHGGKLWLAPNVDAGMTARFVLPSLEERVSHVSETDGVHHR